jgi:hypothetical protein
MTTSWNPYLFQGARFQSEDTGQLTIFWVDEEPPDPDDHPHDYTAAFLHWASIHPELAAAL